MQARKRNRFKYRALTAGTVAAITATTVSLQAAEPHTPNPHELPVTRDRDADLLTDEEEIALAYLVDRPDQNRNSIPDGIELAASSFQLVSDLPVWDPADGTPEPQQTYKKIVAAAFGIEKCAVCGDDVVMIKWEIVNPKNGARVELTDMTLHYLANGSFSFHSLDGWSGKGRISVADLLEALQLRLPSEPGDHQLPLSDDADSDLLSDREEYAVGYDFFESDQNGNNLPDGAELAKRCAAVVDALPSYPPGGEPSNPKEIYKIEHALDGLERCHVCGRRIHMGGWTIVNPTLPIRYPDKQDPMNRTFLPDLALHYMQHGSFDCFGDVHAGRVDLQRLLRVLETPFPYDPNDHELPVDGNDLDADLLTDEEELRAGYNMGDPDQNDNLTPDGIDLAKQCARIIDNLPVYEPNTPGLQKPYKASFLQRGLEACHVCGDNRNMGYWLIMNPKLGISVEVPDIACHYMSHGSFGYSGDVHGLGRTDVIRLVRTLEIPVECGDLGTLYGPADVNLDCKTDFKDLAALAEEWLGSTEPTEPRRSD